MLPAEVGRSIVDNPALFFNNFCYKSVAIETLLMRDFYRLQHVDSNGYLDERDFACLALRATIIEGKRRIQF
ncbi:hypothetical protein NQ317_008973 [Molorchus minor]|uniref:EF-hand domain-containing protein n=1 Tax=Molorchus minor TaxID=1323400 RepID=A0ABQ9JA64_9CUCU|nr:hypothetical protein NQ317_008973 [Molorchus minor]